MPPIFGIDLDADVGGIVVGDAAFTYLYTDYEKGGRGHGWLLGVQSRSVWGDAGPRVQVLRVQEAGTGQSPRCWRRHSTTWNRK